MRIFKERSVFKTGLFRLAAPGWILWLTTSAAMAAGPGRDVFVLTSTNAAPNQVVVFRLNTAGQPALSLESMLPTGGSGGAGGNAGILQFGDESGAVANFGSSTVTQLMRTGNTFNTGKTIPLASGCVHPVSVALSTHEMFVVGSNCAQSFSWPSGLPDGATVVLTDNSAAQIAAGETWAGITLKSGSVVQLPLTPAGALAGTRNTVALPANANNTPLGAAFWGDIMGFNPAHSPDSFAVLNKSGSVSPVLGPQPAYPSNAPCWLAKGRGNIWYSANSPGQSISIFFSDGQGGAFYKSVALPGVPTDITVSRDGNWLAVIYTDIAGAHVAVFSVDAYGDLAPVATSAPVGIASFNGVAISE